MASTTLTKTFASAGNRKTWTFSAWVKRTSLSANVIFSSGLDANYFANIEIDNNNRKFQFFVYQNATTINLITTRLFRDTNAWYHIVLAVDSTQATASDRVKLYVNGVQETAFDTAIYPAQNADNVFNADGYTYRIGVNSDNNGRYFDGLMSHIHMCDGTQYQASDFGSTDSTTGEWKINTSPSVTYGNNGFFILKDGNSVTDQSGNGNNFTVGGGTLTNTEDSPSNVFATMNSLDNFYQSATFSNGNNTIVTHDTRYAATMSTLGMTSGKYYAEMKATNIYNGYSQFGIRGTFVTSIANGAGQGTDGYAYIANGGQKRNNDSSSAYGTAWNSGDIIGCAVDLDNNYIYWSRNGTWQNSGDPTSGATGTGAAFSLGTPSSGAYFFAASDNDAGAGTSNTFDFNFGNGYFGTTAVSSAGTNASGIGIFEYDVPTGYTALSTKGLNL